MKTKLVDVEAAIVGIKQDCCSNTEIKTKLVEVEAAIEGFKQDLQKMNQQYCKIFSFKPLQETIQYLETSIKQHNDQINILNQTLHADNETSSNTNLKMVQISYSVYELTPSKKKPIHNICESKKHHSTPVPSSLSINQPKDESKLIRYPDASVLK